MESTLVFGSVYLLGGYVFLGDLQLSFYDVSFGAN